MARNIVGNFIVNSIQEVSHLTAWTIMCPFMHLVEKNTTAIRTIQAHFILKDKLCNRILNMSKLYGIRNFEKLEFVIKFHELYLWT
jgi:hypothetical protein